MGDLLLGDNSNNTPVQNLVDNFRDIFNGHDPEMQSSLLGVGFDSYPHILGVSTISVNIMENCVGQYYLLKNLRIAF
jgi:hypothetical protein